MHCNKNLKEMNGKLLKLKEGAQKFIDLNIQTMMTISATFNEDKRKLGSLAVSRGN